MLTQGTYCQQLQSLLLLHLLHQSYSEQSSPLKERQHTKLDEYVNFLKTLGKTDDEIFSTLRMCYEEPEELAEISTYPTGVHKAQDF